MKKIILDCDPGHDDAIALLLAWGNPQIDLLAVTTVVGNQTLDKVTRNALAVARIANITGVPFAAGCPRPLVRNIEVAPDIHGDSGLDGPVLPEPHLQLDSRHAVDLIIDTVMAHPPGSVTLVPTGGLTNIAMAVRKEPRIAERVKEVVLMGGGYHVGNWSAVAEFNIKIDPEAAHIVFNEKWPLTMVGLDLTHQALATPAGAGLQCPAGARSLRGGLCDRSERHVGAQSAGGYRVDRHPDVGHDGRGLPRAAAAGLPHPGRGQTGSG